MHGHLNVKFGTNIFLPKYLSHINGPVLNIQCADTFSDLNSCIILTTKTSLQYFFLAWDPFINKFPYCFKGQNINLMCG